MYEVSGQLYAIGGLDEVKKFALTSVDPECYNSLLDT
jgi:hypothetical protein